MYLYPYWTGKINISLIFQDESEYSDYSEQSELPDQLTPEKKAVDQLTPEKKAVESKMADEKMAAIIEGKITSRLEDYFMSGFR